MKIISKIIKFVNPSQVPVDVSDQPVYALSKEIQMRDPSSFGPDKYVCLFGDLHIEIELLRIHGELIKGSGLDAILDSANLSTLGTSAVIDVNNNKRARYCLEVAVCAIYRLLVDTHTKDSVSSTPLHWHDGRSSISQICFYFKSTSFYSSELSEKAIIIFFSLWIFFSSIILQAVAWQRN